MLSCLVKSQEVIMSNEDWIVIVALGVACFLFIGVVFAGLFHEYIETIKNVYECNYFK